MKRFVISFIAILAAGMAAAAGDAGEVLRALSAKIRSMPGYAVEFSLRSGTKTVRGQYTVRGDAFYMKFGEAEVYSDGKIRREVDPDKNEVVVDAVDPKSHNILNNPTRAFDLAPEQFAAELVEQTPQKSVVRLTPNDKAGGVTTVVLTVDAKSGLPVALSYMLDHERIEVEIHAFGPTDRAPRKFRAADYAGFETIDFR